MRTAQRGVQIAVILPDLPTTLPSRADDRPRPGGSSTSRGQTAGLVVAALLLGVFVGSAVPTLSVGAGSGPVHPLHLRLDREHTNRIPLGPSGPVTPLREKLSTEHLNRVALGPGTGEPLPAAQGRSQPGDD